ncbi:hypothetical protein ACI6QG_08395 [Roseococcus sp. DSY-14]|uniref:alginate O-acetyltransferase AlgX-related protein n=1 Tax=Roseococcus sp. DSY-14 TaxID=3369650 RepID=UPI00387B7767
MTSGATRRGAMLAGLALPFLGGAAAAQNQSLVVVGKDRWLFPAWDRVNQAPDGARIRGVTEVLNQAVALLKQANVETAIGLIPSKGRVYRQHLPDSLRVNAETDRRYALLQSELRRPGTLVPDLDAPFRAAAANARPPEQLFFRTDTHWAPAGAELAAREMAKAIRERFRLPAHRGGGTPLGNPVAATNNSGDLVRFLPAAERAAFIPEEYRQRGAAQRPAAALLAEDDGDVTVVGNSFVQPRFGFPDVLSNQLERPVRLAWNVNNIGPFFTLLEHVRSDAFRRQKPRVLVWMLLEMDAENLPNSGSWGQSAMAPAAFTTGLRQALGV